VLGVLLPRLRPNHPHSLDRLPRPLPPHPPPFVSFLERRIPAIVAGRLVPLHFRRVPVNDFLVEVVDCFGVLVYQCHCARENSQSLQSLLILGIFVVVFMFIVSVAVPCYPHHSLF
jgi:hypothetical protein